ncbi:hypothetical protein F1D05_16980 [Kribbella qitaiheensis]|uniref:Fibronectin type III domain-containing protein n=1 Tax=Kribbella qitaiheensis TaxID=1544730 RepID=A0A7G6WZ85_9ACTN|nr:hypothetical protein [Kribbella qitaiheensis]QNE19300.1 hypothetical protein F1D05_16980 [Kribbella qitaiheensis]
MKKWPALAVTATVLTSMLPTGAFAADLPDPAPTNVQVSWDTHFAHTIRVTWDEAEARPNKVVVRDLDASADREVFYPAADRPNTVTVGTLDLWNRAHLQIVVVAGTVTTVTSPEGRSAVFDGYVPDTTVDAVTPTATGITVKAHSTAGPDSTPGDPLDGDDQVKYEPVYRSADRQRFSLGPAGTETEFSISHPAPNYTFNVETSSRWAPVASGDDVVVDHARLTATTPARWQYGSEMKITGSHGKLIGQQQRVVLQARNSPTSPWYVVTYDVGSYEDGSFSFSFLAMTREYRIAMANSFTRSGADRGDWSMFYGGYSAPMKTVAFQRVYGVFTTPTIKVGQTSNVHVQLNVFLPTGLVALQRWNGKTWVFVQNIALKDNVGWAKVTGKAVGSSTYRIYSPNVIKDGMLVAAAYSPNFVLSVIR